MKSTALLTRAFAHTLPSTAQALFLAACTMNGEAARNAIGEWLRRSGPDPLGGLDESDRERLSLLLSQTERSGAALPPSVLSVLRAARLHEEIRAGAVVREINDVLGLLRANDIRPVVVGDAPIAEHLYEDWSVRHCSRLELLMDEPDLGRSVGLLQATRGPERIVATRPSGFSIEVRARWLLRAGRPETFEETLERSEPRRLAGTEARCLSNVATVVELTAGAGPHRDSSRWWVVDLAVLIQKDAALDWDRVAAIARRNRALLPLWLRASWLADSGAVEIPQDFLTTIEREARAEGGLALVAGIGRVIARRLR